MLQIDHIYEFFYNSIFTKDFEVHTFRQGVPNEDAYIIFNQSAEPYKILFYDQEPLLEQISTPYLDHFNIPFSDVEKNKHQYPILYRDTLSGDELKKFIDWNKTFVRTPFILANSEHSDFKNYLLENYKFKNLYYFFHGFAALDWYRGHYALNYDKPVVKEYKHDFLSFNRIINNDRSYRIYFVSKLKELGLLDHGQVSFNVTDNLFDDWQDEVADPNSKLSEHAKQHAEHHLTNIDKLVIDNPQLPGSASADIPRGNDAFWHIVTETVFYYDKLHLTEKIFKPIVSKQPFMLLAAPGNLAYLKNYGFKTFDSVIDESYDSIQDNDLRTEAVVRQLYWYCNLSLGEKTDIIKQLEPIIEHNFNHFYGEFRHIITRELLDNTKTLFKEIGYDDSHINYANIHHVLTH
jgi:hypothetical protein